MLPQGQNSTLWQGYMNIICDTFPSLKKKWLHLEPKSIPECCVFGTENYWHVVGWLSGFNPPSAAWKAEQWRPWPVSAEWGPPSFTDFRINTLVVGHAGDCAYEWESTGVYVGVCLLPCTVLSVCLTLIVWQWGGFFLKLNPPPVIYERKKWHGLHEERKHTPARTNSYLRYTQTACH